MLLIVGKLSLLRISELLEKIARNNLTLRSTKDEYVARGGGFCEWRSNVRLVTWDASLGLGPYS